MRTITGEEIKSWQKDLLPLEGVSSSFLRQLKVFPFLIDGSAFLLIPSPSLLSLADLLSKKLQTSFEVLLADEALILELIQKFYEAEEEYISEEESSLVEDEEVLKDLASEAPVIRLVNKIIRDGLESRATDIHLEAQKTGLKVRFRIDGVLHDVALYPKAMIAPVISRIKLMSQLNIAEHRLPQDGRIKFLTAGENIDIRVSTIPTILGESVVLRLLTKDKSLLNLENLGFTEKQYQTFLKLLNAPNGIILVTGPTGSGKTTTLYAALSKLNSPDKKIITIEDPVEYQLEGINQIPIKPDIGLTFATCLRSILRHDPDIILVGEIRDKETAEIAIQASLTGHLVFSTLHTNSALGAITRLAEMGIERYLISASVIGLLAQRLIRVLCPYCKKPQKPNDAFLRFIQNLPNPPQKIDYFIPQGCEKCSHTGYLGRQAIYEVFDINSKLLSLLDKEDELKDYLHKNQYLTMFQHGLLKVAQGLTSFEEILRVVRQ